MEAKWIIARRLCLEKLNTFEYEKLHNEEKKQNRMFGSNEIIKMFFSKLKWMCNKSMPVNAMDLFYTEIIPCCPKVTIEVQTMNGVEQKYIGGTQILQWFDSGSIVNVLHLWDSQMDLANKKLWDTAVFKKKGKNDNDFADEL